MFEVKVMWQGGSRLTPKERALQCMHRGEFLADIAHSVFSRRTQAARQDRCGSIVLVGKLKMPSLRLERHVAA